MEANPTPRPAPDLPDLSARLAVHLRDGTSPRPLLDVAARTGLLRPLERQASRALAGLEDRAHPAAPALRAFLTDARTRLVTTALEAR